MNVSFCSEALRLQERVEQVRKQQDRGKAGQNVVHVLSLELFASLGEAPAGHKEKAAHADVEEIRQHSVSFDYRSAIT
jgi:hypothetical protein